MYRSVKDHKGYITVQSEAGKGSTFFVYFPVSGKSIHMPASPEISFSPETQTILVVDDEEEVRELIRDILETHGYRVLHSADPLSALDITKNLGSHLHLVITDIMMPLMNGEELIEKLKKLKPDLPVIAISAYSDGILEQDSMMVDVFLQKPFEASSLLSSVTKVMESRANKFPSY